MNTEEKDIRRPFAMLGVRFISSNETQYIGVCPVCGKNKFYLNRKQALWDCKVCSTAGNLEGFLGWVSKYYRQHFKGEALKFLSQERGIAGTTFRAWGVGFAGDFYTVPVNGNTERKVVNVKRFYPDKKKLRFISTPGCRHAFVAPIVFGDPAKPLWITEGEWDAMALWETLRACGRDEEVICVPGASVVPNESLDLIRGREVTLIYDNDDAGEQGKARFASRLDGITRNLQHVQWKPEDRAGVDYRDLFREHGAHSALQYVLDRRIAYRPVERAGRSMSPGFEGNPGVYTGAGMSSEQVEASFRRWLKIRSPECLDVMFGTCLANRLEGDPLWLFMVAPPGGMKTELLISLCDAPGILTVTTLTPHSLISGANTFGGDPSLIPKFNDKVVVIKDFTTILSMNVNARDEIFGILRDAYDGKTEKFFGNGVIRSYDSHFGILAGVTPIIESLSNSSTVLGERFIKYNLMLSQFGQTRKDDSEIIKKALLNLRENNAMRTQLRDTARRVLDWDISSKPLPDIPDDMLDRLVMLAQWVATLRGVVNRERYTGIIQFKPMTEIGTRLAKQFCKLAYGISFYRGEAVVSEQTYRTVVHVAQSTSPDRVEELVKQIYIHTRKPGDAFALKDVVEWSKFPIETTRFLLQDLALLKLIQRTKNGNWVMCEPLLKTMKGLRIYAKEKAYAGRRTGTL